MKYKRMDSVLHCFWYWDAVGFLPVGEKYIIFEIQKDQMDLEGFCKGGLQKEFAEDMLELLDVPKGEKPDFSKEYI